MSVIRTLVVSISSALFSLAAEQGAVTGQIQDVTGAVIPGATVTIRSEWTGKTIQGKTDGKGSYDLRDLEGDDYTLRITAPGFDSITVKSISLSDGELKLMPPLDLSVSRSGCEGGTPLDYLRFLPSALLNGNLGGSVRVYLGPMAGDSPPVANAQVRLICDSGRICGTARTDSGGRFMFLNLSPQSYGLRFSSAGFYTHEEPGYEVKGGREMFYYPVYLEGCPRGNCDPKLRPKKPLVICE